MKSKWTITIDLETTDNEDSINIAQDIVALTPLQRLGLIELLKSSVLKESDACQK